MSDYITENVPFCDLKAVLFYCVLDSFYYASKLWLQA